MCDITFAFYLDCMVLTILKKRERIIQVIILVTVLLEFLQDMDVPAISRNKIFRSFINCPLQKKTPLLVSKLKNRGYTIVKPLPADMNWWDHKI